jgi:hypothetical protein
VTARRHHLGLGLGLGLSLGFRRSKVYQAAVRFINNLPSL